MSSQLIRQNATITKNIFLSILGVQCQKPVSLLDGKILSNKKLFYYEDQIDIECDHGYYLTTNTHTLKCESHGQWSADMPHCKSKNTSHIKL